MWELPPCYRWWNDVKDSRSTKALTTTVLHQVKTIASSQAFPALKVVVDDECSGKGLVFTKNNEPGDWLIRWGFPDFWGFPRVSAASRSYTVYRRSLAYREQMFFRCRSSGRPIIASVEQGGSFRLSILKTEPHCHFSADFRLSTLQSLPSPIIQPRHSPFFAELPASYCSMHAHLFFHTHILLACARTHFEIRTVGWNGTCTWIVIIVDREGVECENSMLCKDHSIRPCTIHYD